MLPFVEILNFHSHSNRTINIFVMEETTQYVYPDRLYAINTQAINIKTYSSFGNSTRFANIIFKNTGIGIFSKKSRFTVLANSNLNINAALANSALDDRNKQHLSFTNNGFMIGLSGVTMQNLRMITELTVNVQDWIHFRLVNINNRTFTLNNMDIQVTGNILVTFDPINLMVMNTVVDHYRSIRGFYVQSVCNFTYSSLQTQISFTNLTASNSKTRLQPVANAFIRIAGGSHFTLTNSNINIWGSDIGNYPVVNVFTLSDCNPADNITQNILISDSIFTLTQNTELTRYVQLKVTVENTHSRPIAVSIKNNVFNNMTMSTSPLFDITGNTKTAVALQSMAIENMSFSQSIMKVFRVLSLSMTSISFKNITKFGRSLIQMTDAQKVDISAVTIDCKYATKVFLT